MEAQTIHWAASRRGSRTRQTPDKLARQQFAEAFYLMVMASELRNRATALGRRYGVDSLEMRAEILRYLERFAADLSSDV